MNKRNIGENVENMVCEVLKERGYSIEARNYRVRQGEIDIIARESDYLVFMEVKYRKNNKSGDAFDAVNLRKQRQISKVALYYMQQKGIPDSQSIRFDVVAVNGRHMSVIADAFPFCYEHYI